MVSSVKKLRVGIIYGGRSGEHEVSLASAAAVFKNLDPDRYDAVPIKIEKDGRWTLPSEAPAIDKAADVIHGVLAGAIGAGETREAQLIAHPGRNALLAGVGLDVIFPVLHGPYGED